MAEIKNKIKSSLARVLQSRLQRFLCASNQLQSLRKHAGFCQKIIYFTHTTHTGILMNEEQKNKKIKFENKMDFTDACDIQWLPRIILLNLTLVYHSQYFQWINSVKSISLQINTWNCTLHRTEMLNGCVSIHQCALFCNEV